ncbi:hypothetical protein [Roseiconus lacunae]|uniref:Uncharacterized protein n=1 Tax=Roseiconus lacunae TaxID=2605694 RepID=A0ABT7PNX3_9BACT|nr:hypothetical protein [Roseiconus lacunae]MDM4018182.1 hypothetical protein [Roseiconus lacunae]
MPSSTDFGRVHFTDRMTDDRHAAAEKITRNMPGMERRKERLILRGIGLLDRVDTGYRLSKAGKELGTAYRSAPDGTEWVKILGHLLLTREPRTRTLIKLISEPNAELYFTDDEWWGGSLQRATINFSDGKQLVPFAKSEHPIPNLRSAVRENSWWALGEWRDHEDLSAATDCRFVGQLKEDFSMHDISLAIRSSMEVLLHLGVIRSQADRCWLDQDAAVQTFGMTLANEFGWQSTGKKKSLREWIIQFADDLRLDTGFIVASELRDRLRQQGFDNPDREIARLESEGRVVIEATDYGQSRHGVGLYDDPSKQLIKLRVS